MVEFQQLLSHPFILSILVIWSLFWKGVALWRAARLSRPWWFLALLVINTAGILEIIFLIISKRTYRERFL